MKTVRLYDKGNAPERVDEVVRVLADGGVVAFPTGTTYALGCHALKERAVERICKIRGIDPASHPLSVICYDLSEISAYAHIPTPVFKLMKRNLPGAFTFILPGKNRLPKVFRSRKTGEVGIRMPESPIVRELQHALGSPLMTASLPVGEGDDPELVTDPELVAETYGSLVDLVVDGGQGRQGQSTVVNCCGDEPEIVRQGDGDLR